ncbi:class I SAM-dependent methyltransferase [Streptomyces sp. NPDC057889]|uniref:class I SAM-dependent methyltransferase n=1 Tax=unclassified Streptomyces TaxID=2593676 RepID=UPI0036B6C808
MTATLPRVLPSPDGKPLPPPGTGDTFRTFAQDLATSRRPWTAETAQFIAEQFDELAADWDTNRATGRDEPVRDALARGGLLPQGPCLELGSGTGLFTPVLTAAFPEVISIDLSMGMLQQAQGRSPQRVQADAGALPLPDASVTVVAAIDILLFSAETARVLAPDGVLLWINQLGSDGPLYLPASDVAAALPGTWQATESEAGWGSWAVLRRWQGGMPKFEEPHDAPGGSGSPG